MAEYEINASNVRQVSEDMESYHRMLSSMLDDLKSMKSKYLTNIVGDNFMTSLRYNLAENSLEKDIIVMNQLSTTLNNIAVEYLNCENKLSSTAEGIGNGTEISKEARSIIDMDIVDGILSKDPSEISDQEYQQIAIILGRQPREDAALLEHILNSEYCWKFVDDNGGVGDISMPSYGYFAPTEQLLKLSQMMGEYAYALCINEPSDTAGTEYVPIKRTAVQYDSLLREIINYSTADNTIGYITNCGQEEEMVKARIEESKMFSISMEDSNLQAKIAGAFGDEKITISNVNSGDQCSDLLKDQEHTSINEYLGLGKSNKEIITDEVKKLIGDKVTDYVVDAVGKSPYVETAVDAVTIAKSYDDYHEMETKILEFEKWTDNNNIASTFDLNMCLTTRDTAEGQGSTVITVYPSAETQDRIDTANYALDNDASDYKINLNINNLPEGKFTLDYVMNDFDKASADINIVWDNMDGNDYATSIE
ncbi:hypothetical protein, partial [Anaerosporobacter sp.]